MTSLAYISSGIRAEFRSPFFWDVHAFLLDPTTLSTFPSEMVASPQFRLVGGDNTDWIHSGQMAGWASTVPFACLTFQSWQFGNHPLPSSCVFFTILRT